MAMFLDSRSVLLRPHDATVRADHVGSLLHRLASVRHTWRLLGLASLSGGSSQTSRAEYRPQTIGPLLQGHPRKGPPKSRNQPCRDSEAPAAALKGRIEPTGSKYSIFEVSGFKNHVFQRFLEPEISNIWYLEILGRRMKKKIQIPKIPELFLVCCVLKQGIVE